MSEIKVVPCHSCQDDGRHWFHVQIDGVNQPINTQKGFPWCGTEAEALEKAAELRRENGRTLDWPGCAECGHSHESHRVRHTSAVFTCNEIECDCKQYRTKIDPIEQAAPPRPLEFTQDDISAACKWRILCQNPQLNLNPVESPVDAILKRLAAPAAIEQARPQTPHPLPSLEMMERLEGKKFVPTAAAAEPAPERTPPQDIDEIVTRLYRRFKEWNKRGFGPDDVTWCEVKADLLEMIAAQTPEEKS